MPKVAPEELTVKKNKMMIQEWEVDKESIANNNENVLETFLANWLIYISSKLFFLL